MGVFIERVGAVVGFVLMGIYVFLVWCLGESVAAWGGWVFVFFFDFCGFWWCLCGFVVGVVCMVGELWLFVRSWLVSVVFRFWVVGG